ncbi:hydantoinase/oxoprolinase family protein [Microvirga sp. 17 mud 1-3]|uniref:hydantoinase/oxoprolinase family protein n=1 Tax=Microvirga sp. 17 mud 1-3 TaxID=2082949 RepID=UPI0013A531FA|nr:hydantoinase/oxoprolinase family protein [Microvirga sp. 17 mud 1-3]
MHDHALGIDIGGTFTDIALLDCSNGTVRTGKVLTTHDNPVRGAMEGVQVAMGGVVTVDQISRVVHATTLFTNALIERRGARAGLITTAGFEDTLSIGREKKYDIYDLHLSIAAPVIPAVLRRGVVESIGADGQVHRPLDKTHLRAAVDELRDQQIDSLAVCFQNSYIHSAHEKAAFESIREWFPDLAVTASCEVAPQIGEFERMSTTAANAYLQPLARSYIGRLQNALLEAGITAPLSMMLSNGGLTDVDEAMAFPVRLLESGPAAGVLSAASFAQRLDEDRILAFDMGGTTAKLALVEKGTPKLAYAFEAAPEKRFARGSGLPMHISTVELIEIGAGGGSLAHKDKLGLLKVGPQSAGSNPGPVVYGLGGSHLTVTDSDFLIGALNPDYFAGGDIPIALDKAREAAASLGAELLLDGEKVAFGVYDIVCENMAAAARVHVASHGRDIRTFTLYATGGAAPVHAVHVAKKLGIARVIVPVAAGVASALGLLIAPARSDRSQPVGRLLDRISPAEIEARFAVLEEEARAVVRRSVEGSCETERLIDIRYSRQGTDLTLRIPGGTIDTVALQEWERLFNETYRHHFGRALPGQPIEISMIRVVATSPSYSGPVNLLTEAGEARQTSERMLVMQQGMASRRVPVCHRQALDFGCHDGPILIEEKHSTIVAGHECSVTVTADGTLIIDLA